MKNEILHGDALSKLKEIPSESVDCIITSPPYWALRDYKTEGTIWDENSDCQHDFSLPYQRKQSGGTNHAIVGNHKDKRIHFNSITNTCTKCYAWKGELGQEPTIDLYINHLVQIFDECKRVLKKEGTCWVVIGDTYSGGDRDKSVTLETKRVDRKYPNKTTPLNAPNRMGCEIVSKSLCMIPERFAIAMIDKGWILRNKIIWHKRNCMPSSAKDRFTIDYEYVYFFTKNRKYYFKTQYEPYQSFTEDPLYRKQLRMNKKYNPKEPYKKNFPYMREIKEGYNGHGIKPYEENNVQNPSDVKRRILASMKKNMPPIGGVKQLDNGNPTYSGNTPEWNNSVGRIKRCVWTINTKPFSEAHFAVFPESLVQQCLDAGCPSEICKKCGKAKSIEYIQETPFWGKKEGGKKRNPDRGNTGIVGQKYQNWLNTHPKQIQINSCNCNSGFESGIVLDPFLGSGTTALVALKYGRSFLGIELNKDYIEIANKRLERYLYQEKLPIYNVEQ